MDRLTAGDLNTLWPDDVGWPQDIGVLAVLDADRLPHWRGRPDIDRIRHAIESRLHREPRFRQRLYWPRLGLGWPLWADAPDFDIADHVGVYAVPPSGGDVQLLRAVEHLRRRRLDRAHPLWAMWLLPGLEDGGVGCYLRVHHVMADGASGLAVLGSLFDDVPHPNMPYVPPFAPAPVPSSRALFRDNVRVRLHGLARTMVALAHPVATLGRIRAGWPAVRETLASGRVPRTSLNTPIGPARVFALVRGRLDAVLATGHRCEATANDVLLAAVAGGLRDLLLSRGERVDGLVLRAYVPVSLHHEVAGPARGNLTGLMAASLPVGVADVSVRLRLIAAETAERRRRRRPPSGALLPSGLVQRALLPLMKRQRWANVYVANVPGPHEPLYLAGARVRELFPVVPLLGNITLGIGVLSYAGQFNITAVGDRDACGDVAVFADGARAALRSLTLADEPLPTGRR